MVKVAPLLVAVLAVLAAPGTAAAAPRLEVAPLPAGGKPAPSTPIVSWDTGDGTPGQVTVASDGSKETVFASAPKGSLEAPWLGPGSVHVFRLYALAGKRTVVATLTVGDSDAPQVIFAQPAGDPPDTPRVVDRILQVAPAPVAVIVAMLTVQYIRERRHAV